MNYKLSTKNMTLDDNDNKNDNDNDNENKLKKRIFLTIYKNELLSI